MKDVNGTRDEGQSRAYDLLERAREFLRTGHPHQAAILLARAKAIEPEKGSIREALGRALYQSGRAARARRGSSSTRRCPVVISWTC